MKAYNQNIVILKFPEQNTHIFHFISSFVNNEFKISINIVDLLIKYLSTYKCPLKLNSNCFPIPRKKKRKIKNKQNIKQSMINLFIQFYFLKAILLTVNIYNRQEKTVSKMTTMK